MDRRLVRPLSSRAAHRRRRHGRRLRGRGSRARPEGRAQDDREPRRREGLPAQARVPRARRLSHPNLVALYDLVVADESCFFTMELLDGVDFISLPVARRPSTTCSRWRRRRTRRCATPTRDVADAIDRGESPTERARRSRRRATSSGCATRCRSSRAACTRSTRPARSIATSSRRTSRSRATAASCCSTSASSPSSSAGSGADGRSSAPSPYMAPEQCAGDVALTAGGRLVRASASCCSRR